MEAVKQACSCMNWSCRLPPCDECGEDHGGITYGGRRVCRDCHLDIMMTRLSDEMQRDPEAFEKRLAEVAAMFAGKKRRK